MTSEEPSDLLRDTAWAAAVLLVREVFCVPEDFEGAATVEVYVRLRAVIECYDELRSAESQRGVRGIRPSAN